MMFSVINSGVKSVRINEHINHRLPARPGFIFSWASWFFDLDFANHVYPHIQNTNLYNRCNVGSGLLAPSRFFISSENFKPFLLVILLDPCSCSCCSIVTSPEMIGSPDRSCWEANYGTRFMYSFNLLCISSREKNIYFVLWF